MAVYAYLRVSTADQDIASQRHGLLAYANKAGLARVEIVEDTASSKRAWRERRIGEMVDKLQEGDALLTPEISRLARSTLEALEVIKAIVEAGATLHITKDSKTIGGDIQDTIYTTVLALAAEIERDFIQRRTREALGKRQSEIAQQGYFISAAGVKRQRLGRPAGDGKSKLDAQRAEIEQWLNMGLSKAAICKLAGCTYPTLAAYISRHGLNTQKGIGL